MDPKEEEALKAALQDLADEFKDTLINAEESDTFDQENFLEI
tara:strand:+ start:1249 stop:1374 length:126 start_codon:yes stop_codon:yes gene_type:complete